MQLVEHLPRRLATTHAVQERLIAPAPGIGNRAGTDRQAALAGNSRHFSHDAAAPIDDCPKDVEGKHFQIAWSVTGQCRLTPGPG